MISTLKRIIAGLSLLAFAAWLPAQVFTGTITGTLTDPNAAAISGATVRAKNEANGDTRTVTTNNEGLYTLSQLPPGVYEISAEMTGFKKSVQKEVKLSVNQTIELNLGLQLGEVSQVVEVTAGVSLLDTQSANRAVTLDSQAVLDLPVNARNPFVHVHLNAGVIAVRTGISQATQDQNHNRFSMNGGRGQAGLTLIDGVPAAAVDWGGLIASPSVDSVQEVNIQRNQFDAQFGKSDGGAVNMITKGGSNDIHGAVFNFLRNDNLDANLWQNNRSGLRRTEFQRNQFGAAVGGPLWKSKRLYYFGTYEGLRQGSPNTFIGSVPTAAQRAGDFSNTRNADGSLSQIYNPYTTRANPNGAGFVRDPFPNNQIPASLISAVGRNVVNLYPQPNAAGDPFVLTRNFNSAGKTVTTNDRVDGRIDWSRNEKHTMFGRFTKAWQENKAPEFLGGGADTNFSDVNPRHLVVIGNTFTPSPTWVINVLLGSGRWRENQISPSRGQDGTKVGLPSSVVALFDTQTLPQFNMQNYSSIGNPRWLNSARETHSLQANFTKELGAHSLKFGWLGELARLNNTDFNTPNFSFNRGLSGVTRDAQGNLVAGQASTFAGDGIASLLLGAGSGGSVPTNPATATTARYDGFYIQDSWRVNRRLTVHIGVRYEIQYARTERFNRLNTFDPNIPSPLAAATRLPLTGGLVFANADNRGAWDTQLDGWAPRFGLAYKISDRLVFRGGYGIFYPQGGNTQNSGFSATTAWVSTIGGDGLRPNPAAPLTNPFPQGLATPTGASLGAATLVGESVGAMYRYYPNAYVQNISADFQYEVAKGMVLEVGYSGSQGRKLLLGTGVNINQLHPQYLSLGAQLDQPVANPFLGVISSGVLSGATVPRHRLLRPYPQFNAVNQGANIPGGGSSFHAMVVRYNWQIAGGLNLLTTYQWSKAIDDASEWQGWEVSDTLRDAYNRRVDRSISAHDLPQSFVSAMVYDLPVGKGKKYMAAMPAVANAVLGGWQVSSIVRLGSGLPLGFTANNTLGAYGFGVQRPNISDLKLLAVDNPTPDRWFNVQALSQPGTYEIGNMPRWVPNVRFGPTRHWDLAILKNFRFGERLKAQFRAEMFNATNTPQFGRASTNIVAGDVGRVSGTTNVGPRNVQLGLRITF
jgi:hypothetical protein